MLTDGQVIEELTAASKAEHVTFDSDEQEFVRGLRGLSRLDPAQRRRARLLFQARVDW